MLDHQNGPEATRCVSDPFSSSNTKTRFFLLLSPGVIRGIGVFGLALRVTAMNDEDLAMPARGMTR